MEKVFITRKLPKIAFESLIENKFIVDCYDKNESFPHEELVKIGRNYDIILSCPTDKFNREVLSLCNRLKVISNYAVGLDNIDIKFACSIGIKIYNTPDVVTNSTADHTLALLLTLIRKINSAHEFIKNDNWRKWDPYLFIGDELNNKTFGIIGFGRIGQAVAKRAIGFGVKLIYHDSENKEIDSFIKPFVKKVEFDELLSTSDYISVHAPLNENTKYMINSAVFERMKRTPILINTARGQVVNGEDLIIALEKKLVRGAVLDVTDPEPIGGDHKLLSFDNCIVTPHIGTATSDTRYNMAKLAAQNIIDHYRKND